MITDTKAIADRAIGHFAEAKRISVIAGDRLNEMGAALELLESPIYPNDLMRRIQESGNIHGVRS